MPPVKTMNLKADNTAPAEDYFAITPHDSTDFTQGPIRGFYVGGDGNVVCVTMDGTAVAFTGVKGGMYYPFRCKRINSTNTTATGLVGLL